MHVPAAHTASLISNQRAAWLRCRVIESEDGQPSYSASPQITHVSAFTIGGTVEAVNAETIVEEPLGLSEGVSGQRLPLERKPVVAVGAVRVLEVATETGWREWNEVNTFAESGEDDEHFLLDAVTGEVVLGPAVRMLDGSLRRYGAVPPKGAMLRLASYQTGGGRRGNVDAKDADDPQVVDPVRRVCGKSPRQPAAASTARTSRTRRVAARWPCVRATAP